MGTLIFVSYRPTKNAMDMVSLMMRVTCMLYNKARAQLSLYHQELINDW